MLVAHQFGHRLRIHPLQAFDAAGVARAEDAVQQRRRLVFAQGLGQHGADILVRIHTERGVLVGLGTEFVEHPFQFFALDRLHDRHRGAKLLHLARAEVFHHLGGLFLAQSQHQDRSLLYAGITHCYLLPNL